LKDKRALLESISRLAERTIATRPAFYTGPERSAKARQAFAVAGLDPHEWGSSAKKGSSGCRRQASPFAQGPYMPAMLAPYKTARGKRFRDRLAAAGNP